MTTPKSVEVLKIGPGGSYMEHWIPDLKRPGRLKLACEEPIRLKLVELPDAETYEVTRLQQWLAWVFFWKKP